MAGLLYKNGNVAVIGYDLRDLPPVPHIRTGRVGLEDYVVLPHTSESVRLLNNIGVPAAHPILTDETWGWPGSLKPFNHQKSTASFLCTHPRCFVLSDMGTGKTAALIWAFLYLLREGEADRLVVLTPMTTVYSVWKQELFRLRPSLKVMLPVRSDKWDHDEARAAEVIVMNHDAIKRHGPRLRQLPGTSMVVVDEATAFKNTRTDRWRALKASLRPTDRLVLMTGSPMANTPMDCHGLAALVCPSRLPGTKLELQNKLMQPVRSVPGKPHLTKWQPKPGAESLVFDILQPAIRFNKEDCVDLPKLTYQHLSTALTADQKRYLNELRRQSVVKLTGRTITAANAAVELSKALQIAQGIVIDSDDGSVHRIDATPRYEQLDLLVNGARGKVLVFSTFREAVNIIAERYRPNSATITGDTSLNERTEIVERFQNPDDPLRVIAAHPKTAAHGLTLTQADTVVFFGPMFSAELYEQAVARAYRHGQSKPVTVYNISSFDVEKYWFRVLKTRRMTQDCLLDLYDCMVRGPDERQDGRGGGGSDEPQGNAEETQGEVRGGGTEPQNRDRAA